MSAVTRIPGNVRTVLHGNMYTVHCTVYNKDLLLNKRQMSSWPFNWHDLLYIQMYSRTKRRRIYTEEYDEFILFFISSWWKIAKAARNWIDYVSQTAATTFAFSSVYILLKKGNVFLHNKDSFKKLSRKKCEKISYFEIPPKPRNTKVATVINYLVH